MLRGGERQSQASGSTGKPDAPTGFRAPRRPLRDCSWPVGLHLTGDSGARVDTHLGYPSGGGAGQGHVRTPSEEGCPLWGQRGDINHGPSDLPPGTGWAPGVRGRAASTRRQPGLAAGSQRMRAGCTVSACPSQADRQ